MGTGGGSAKAGIPKILKPALTYQGKVWVKREKMPRKGATATAPATVAAGSTLAGASSGKGLGVCVYVWWWWWWWCGGGT
jgi:hypothetical protein